MGFNLLVFQSGRQTTGELKGKFLQPRLGEEEYLIFAPFDQHRYHNQILARFLQERAIPVRWPAADRLEFDVAELEVCGGGRFRVDFQAETLALWDDSQVYGRFDAQGLAERIAAAGHVWSRYAVGIS